MNPLAWADSLTEDFFPIPFGNGVCQKIMHPQLIEANERQLKQLWPHAGTGFAGSLAVSLSRELLMGLDPSYLILPKSDGTRYILFCFQSNKKNMVVMIDRSGSYYKLALQLDPALYHGTIFDGELVKTKVMGVDRTEFQIFDCMAGRGTDISQWPYTKRLAESHILMKGYQPNEYLDAFRIVVKHPIHPQEGYALLLNTQTYTFPLDGLILAKSDQPYVCGKNMTLLKYKKKEDQTIDFRVEYRNGLLSFCVLDHGKDKCVATQTPVQADLETLCLSSWNLVHRQIVECRWLGSSWKPWKIRTDKDLPNNELTLTQTLKNIQEDISPVEMCQKLSGSSRINTDI